MVSELQLFLVDETGVFLLTRGPTINQGEATAGADIRELRIQLSQTEAWRERAQVQLKEALDHHKVHAEEERARRVWRQNCRRLEALDATLVEKGKLFDNLNHEITMGAVIREQQADVEEQRQEALNYAEYPHSEHSNVSLSIAEIHLGYSAGYDRQDGCFLSSCRGGGSSWELGEQIE